MLLPFEYVWPCRHHTSWPHGNQYLTEPMQFRYKLHCSSVNEVRYGYTFVLLFNSWIRKKKELKKSLGFFSVLKSYDPKNVLPNQWWRGLGSTSLPASHSTRLPLPCPVSYRLWTQGEPAHIKCSAPAWLGPHSGAALRSAVASVPLSPTWGSHSESYPRH